VSILRTKKLKKEDGEIMKEQILEILNDINEDVDYETETALIDDGILDSFDIVSLVSELNSNFDINITVVDLVPENFNTLSAMTALVERLSNGN
jgi:acyl carrier protein